MIKQKTGYQINFILSDGEKVPWRTPFEYKTIAVMKGLSDLANLVGCETDAVLVDDSPSIPRSNHYCQGDLCPGYPWRASDSAHPESCVFSGHTDFIDDKILELTRKDRLFEVKAANNWNKRYP